jgi:hypothetical protein
LARGAQCGLVFAQLQSVLSDVQPIIADFLAVLHDLGFTRTVAQIAAEFQPVFSQLSIVLALFGPVVANFFARVANIFEVLANLGVVVMTAIAQAAIMFARHAIKAPVTFAVAAVIFKARVAGIPQVMMEVAPAVAEVPPVMMAKSAVIFGAPIMLLTAFWFGFSSDGKRWNHQSAGN